MSVATLAPPVGHQAAALLERVHRLLDEVQAALGESEPGCDELAELVADCERAGTRLAAVKLALLSVADRTDIARDAGLPSTGAWAAKITRADQAASARQVWLATRMHPEDDQPALPATSAALAEGELSAEHARVIAAACAALPDTLTADQVTIVETDLVRRACTLDPHALRRVARRALAAVEPDPQVVDGHQDALLRDQEARARARTRLTLHDNGDGTTSGHFTVPTLAVAILSKVIQQIASPRRGRLGALEAQAGPMTERGLSTDWAHRHGLALVEILEHLPTDRLGGKVAATVVVTIDEDTLRDRVRAAGLDIGDELSAGEARRIACNAGILPAVLGGGSQVLDLGRMRRFFTEAQQVAASLRWPGCAADGCQRPLAWAEWHHEIPWSAGGPTDLDRAVPLCGWHHQRIHDPDFHHRWTDHRTLTFERRPRGG